jgi:ABC-type branched-subunit amino acid transport system substrate-binding protein
MSAPLRSGDLKDARLVDVFDACCRGGQATVLRVFLGPPGATDMQGAVFFEDGEITDAHLEDSEGLEALRRMLGYLQGRYEVEVGPRSVRRTIEQPWLSLAASLGIIPAKAAPPALRAVEAVRTPSPAPQVSAPRAVPPPAPPSAEHPAVARPVSPIHPPAAPRGTATAAATARRPDSAEFPVSAPATPGPRPAHPSGPRTRPQTGPHATGEVPGRHHTAPFSSIRREGKQSPAMRTGLLVLLAIIVGGGLAAAASKLGLLQRVRASDATPGVAAPTPGAGSARSSAAPVVAGVTETEVTLGMASPLTGASKELGRQMKIGVELAFEQANAAGGVNGRKVKLLALDDGYEPTRTQEVMRELAEQRGVFGFVGNVGTPTAAVAVPYALDRKMLFFGPFTGASLLRKDPPDRYVFNYRASYVEETAATVRYLVETRRVRPEHIAVFAQDDAFGEAGFQGVAKAMRHYKRAPGNILRVSYKRNTADVVDAVDRILEEKGKVEAVVMVATYRPAARFIEKVRDQRPGMIFSNVSFVGSQALAEELVQLGARYPQGVIVTQVVPLPTGQSTVGIRYREALGKYAPGEKPDFVSLEGYVTGNLLVEGLRRVGRNVSTEELVNALETIRGLDVGLGVPLSFGMSEHQASHKVWGTVLDAAGVFQSLDLE